MVRNQRPLSSQQVQSKKIQVFRRKERPAAPPDSQTVPPSEKPRLPNSSSLSRRLVYTQQLRYTAVVPSRYTPEPDTVERVGRGVVCQVGDSPAPAQVVVSYSPYQRALPCERINFDEYGY